MSFYRFKKNQIFTQNPYVLAYDFTEIDSLRKKLTETLNFLVVRPIFWIGAT
jgi:hypothetical protein